MSENQIKGIRIEGYRSLETSDGVAYSARIILDGKVVGMLENGGRGGYTSVNINTEYLEEFRKRVNEYFKELKWDISDTEEYAIDYTFSEHLIDVYEEGKVSRHSIIMGILC